MNSNFVNLFSTLHHIIATDGEVYSVVNNNSAQYNKTVSSVTLSAGKLYTSELSFVTVNPVAMIAYVGNTGAGGYNRGLAIAMTDANGGSPCQWKTSNTNANQGVATTFNHNEGSGIANSQKLDGDKPHCEDAQYPAYYYTYNYKNVVNFDPTTKGASYWFLASSYEWTLMINAMGDSNLRDAFANRGGTNMMTSDYWACTLYDTTNAWYYNFGNGTTGYAPKTTLKYARAVFAF